MIFDSSYHEIARFTQATATGDPETTTSSSSAPQDTALITIYNPVPRDLSSVGGPKDGVVREGIVQELDIETGEVLFEWHSLDHVGLDETYVKPSADGHASSGIDYFHINSIDVDHDDNLLVSARKTSAVYKIDRKRARSSGASGARRATSRWGQAPDSPTSTTPAACPTAPSPSSITARRYS